jgi:chromosome segregation ATPase
MSERKYGPEITDYPDTKEGWRQQAQDRAKQLATQILMDNAVIREWSAEVDSLRAAIARLNTELAAKEADAALDKAELSRIRPKRGDPYFHSTVEEWAAECRQTADLRAELAAVTKDRDELSALIEKQHSRVIKAIRLWRKAHPGNELTWPDLGALIEWLIERKGAAK